MPVEIRVPPLGESVVEATVGRWSKKEGEAVAKDEVLVELETDKITVEVAAQQAGVLQKIEKNEGDIVGVNELLALLDAGAAATAQAPAAAEQPAAAPAAAVAGGARRRPHPRRRAKPVRRHRGAEQRGRHRPHRGHRRQRPRHQGGRAEAGGEGRAAGGRADPARAAPAAAAPTPRAAGPAREGRETRERKRRRSPSPIGWCRRSRPPPCSPPSTRWISRRSWRSGTAPGGIQEAAWHQARLHASSPRP